MFLLNVVTKSLKSVYRLDFQKANKHNGGSILNLAMKTVYMAKHKLSTVSVSKI